MMAIATATEDEAEYCYVNEDTEILCEEGETLKVSKFSTLSLLHWKYLCLYFSMTGLSLSRLLGSALPCPVFSSFFPAVHVHLPGTRSFVSSFLSVSSSTRSVFCGIFFGVPSGQKHANDTSQPPTFPHTIRHIPPGLLLPFVVGETSNSFTSMLQRTSPIFPLLA